MLVPFSLDRLSQIEQHTRALVAETSLTEQQRVFTQHIHRIAQKMSTKLELLPEHDAALFRILPPLHDELQEQLTALLGYATLLHDQPAAFDNARLPDTVQQSLSAIIDGTRDIMRGAEQTVKAATMQRMQRRRADLEPVQLADVMREIVPALEFRLRECAVRLHVNVPDDSPQVYAQRYHLTEYVHHAIVTMATELIEYGSLEVSVRHEIADVVTLVIFCTGITLNPDEMNVLFGKQGRGVYDTELTRMGGTAQIERRQGIGASLLVSLPESR